MCFLGAALRSVTVVIQLTGFSGFSLMSIRQNASPYALFSWFLTLVKTFEYFGTIALYQYTNSDWRRGRH